MEFVNCSFEDIEEQVYDYYENNDILVDSFWEDYACESRYYQIIEYESVIGFCGIYKRQLLTMFHIDINKTNLAQQIFTKAKKLEQVKEAFVPTGDELFLSLAMDNYLIIEKQAYFTRYVKDAKNNDSDLRVKFATSKDKEIIEKYNDEVFADIKEGIEEGYLYIAYKDNKLVGFGVVEPGRIRRDLASLGVYVRPEYRQEGIGKNILLALKENVDKLGQVAISGCSYYNHNSLKTLISVGNQCSTRLLKITF